MPQVDTAASRRLKLARPIADLRQGRTDWFRLENLAGDNPETPGTATLHLYEEIGYWGTTAQDLVTQLAQVTAGTLAVHLNSPGGDVFDGIAIKNALEQHPATVNITVDGIAASIASVIAMAGDTLTMAPGSQMMIHEASGLCIGNAADMAEMQQLLDFQSANIAGIYAGRAGGEAADWRNAMKAETWYTAEEAVAVGLADSVLPGKTRSGAAPAAAMAASNSWDLSIYRYAGRENAPAPKITVKFQGQDFSEEFIASLRNLIRARNEEDAAVAEGAGAPAPADREPAPEPAAPGPVEPAAAPAEPEAQPSEPATGVPVEPEPEPAAEPEAPTAEPSPSDAWAATVAHLVTPQTSTWAAAVAHLTPAAQSGGQDTKEIAQ